MARRPTPAGGVVAETPFAFLPNPGPADPSRKSGHRERLRQRLIEGGPDGFLDYELLEYYLGAFLPRIDTKPLAKALLAEFDDDLHALLAASPADLAAAAPAVREAIGADRLSDSVIGALKFAEALAIRMARRSVLDRPAFSRIEAVTDYLHARLAGRLTEEFRVLFLNNRNILIHDERMGEGTVNQAPVYPREIMRRALELQATALILVHNHPSGDPTPSQDDIRMTRTIVEAGKPLGIAVHDHLVIARSGHTSFRAKGLI